MSAPLQDLADFFEVAPIQFPIRGKIYDFPGTVSGKVGLLLTSMHTAMESAARASRDDADFSEAEFLAKELLDDGETINLQNELLGPAQREMILDGVNSAMIDHVFRVLIVWHAYGAEIGRQAWEGLAPGKSLPGPAPKAPQDRKPKKAATKKAAGSASVSRTRTGSTTSSSAKKAPTARAGARSSSTGASSNKTSRATSAST